MLPSDVARLAWNGITTRRLRSALTVLGIVIGISALVALVSLGGGVQRQIQAELDALGGDSITVQPGTSRAEGRAEINEAFQSPAGEDGFTLQEVRSVRAIPGMLHVNGIVAGTALVTFGGETSRLSVQGMDLTVWAQMEARELVEGRLLVPGDEGAAVVTELLAEDVFTRELVLNQVLDAGGERVRVVGIVEGAGIFGQADTTVFVSQDEARTILGKPDDEVTFLSAKVVPGADVESVAEDLDDRLRGARKLVEGKEDYTIITGKEIQDQVAQVTGSFTAFIGSVAAIALVVGGVGIANAMFMSVLERQRQIGILKALGATDGEVLRLFLAESSLLGFIGGVAGVTVGYVASIGLTQFGTFAFGPPGTEPPIVTVAPLLVVQAMLFAVAVGSLAGILPARRAAGLQPVEALRDV